MKLITMVNAASALRKLSQKDISIKKAYELYRLTQKLNEYLGYFDANREKIISLSDNQDEKLKELLDTEFDVSFDKVKLKLNENIEISVYDIMNLEGFVEFEDQLTNLLIHPYKAKKYHQHALQEYQILDLQYLRLLKFQ